MLSTTGNLNFSSGPSGLALDDNTRPQRLFKITGGSNPYSAQEVYVDEDDGSRDDVGTSAVTTGSEQLWELNGVTTVPVDAVVVGVPNTYGVGWVFDAAAATLTVKESDGVPSYSSITSLEFDQADGFTVTQPGAGRVKIDFTEPTASKLLTGNTATPASGSTADENTSELRVVAPLEIEGNGGIRTLTPGGITFDFTTIANAKYKPITTLGIVTSKASYTPPNGTYDSECSIVGYDYWNDDWNGTGVFIGPLAAGTYLFTSSIIGALLLDDTSDDGSQAEILARYDRRNAGGPNEVQTIVFDAASTGGNLRLTVSDPTNTPVTTANIPWNATDATYLASIQSALDTATGVTNGIVAGGLPDTSLTLTYSGTGYAGLTFALASVFAFPTTSTSATVTRTTTGGSLQTYGDFLIVQGTYNATLANQWSSGQRAVDSGSMVAIITAEENDKVYLQFKAKVTDSGTSPALTAVINLAEILDGYGVGGVARTCWHRLY